MRSGASTARAVRTGANFSAMFTAYPAEIVKADLDGAGEPGSNEGPVQSTTQPERKGAQRSARRGG